MRNVVLVAPYAMPNTLRYVDALLRLDGVRAAVVTADDPACFGVLRLQHLAGMERVSDVGNANQLAHALRALARRLGPIDRAFGVLEQLQLPIARARDAVGVPGMSAEAVERFRDKSAMKAALRAAGVPCARYARVTSLDEASRSAEAIGYPLIVKPVDGLGTRGTSRVKNEAELRAALEALAPSASRPLQLEELVLGTEHSFETVSIDGRPVWSSSGDYLPGPLEVMETPWIQYCVLLPREEERMEAFRQVNHAALSALGMGTGISHMEWFARPDGSTAVNEVGARPPGVNLMPLMSLAHDTDMISAWVGLMALDVFEPPKRVAAAGSAFFRGQGDGERVVAVHGLDDALAALGDLVKEVKRPQLGQARAPGYEGEGFALVAAPTTEEVHRALATLITGVTVELGR